MAIYSFRRSVFTQTETWETKAEGLCDITSGLICPYNKIKSVRLKYSPGRVKTNNYVCEIEFYGTGLKTTISSVSYVSFGNFEDLAVSYRRFIAELAQAVAKANPACKFYSGKKPIHFISEYVAVCLMLALLFWVMVALAVQLSAFIAVKLIIILYSLYYLITAFAINRPGKFNPNEIPEKLLPAATT